MKKLLAVLIAAVLLLTLGACGKADNKDTTPTEEERVLEAPGSADEFAHTFVRAYYTRDYATRFAMTFYNSRQQWEDDAIKGHGSAEEFFTYAQSQADERGIEADVDSFDSYYHFYHKFYLNEILNNFGPYTMSFETTESVRMSEEELNTFRDKILGAINEKYIDAEAFHTVTEAYVVTVTIHVDGEKKDYTEKYIVDVINYNGQWMVASHTT